MPLGSTLRLTKRTRALSVAAVLAWTVSCGVDGPSGADIVQIERVGESEVQLIVDRCGADPAPAVESWEIDSDAREIMAAVIAGQGTTNECQQGVFQNLPDQGEWAVLDSTSGIRFEVEELPG